MEALAMVGGFVAGFALAVILNSSVQINAGFVYGLILGGIVVQYLNTGILSAGRGGYRGGRR